jgi:hypothetical protein
MKRSGKTEKISISLDREDLAFIRRRAKVTHDGNISGVIADAVRYLRYEEGRDALIDAFGDQGKLTPSELEDIAREWSHQTKRATKRRGRRAA